MAKSVELSNGRIWKTKAAAKQHFKAMLARYANGETIEDKDDHSDLCALLERFDVLVAEDVSKIGSGVERFERRLNKGEGWSSPGFWVVRTDGSETDFSYVKAVEGSPKSQAQEFYDACHNAVSRDLLQMKQRQFDHFADADGRIECDLSGQLVTYSEAKLSHANPLFGSIVSAFRSAKGWDIAFPSGLFTSSQDAQLSTQFSDEAVAREFRRHHHSIAVMHIVARTKPDGVAIAASAVKRPLRFG